MHLTGPCLWFDTQAEEAAGYYVSIFKNDSRIVETVRAAEGGPLPAGAVLMVRFILDGRAFSALNGGPHFSFTPAVSFVVECVDQAEVDAMWQRLSDGGAGSRCGWLTDKFGLSWQVVPSVLPILLGSPDRPAANRAMAAMMTMGKLDIARLQQAFDNDNAPA